jgi:NTP pyrophosphatase (non-canonical NTP hydrolase)
MADNSTFSDLSELISNFCKERDWDQYHVAKDLAIGVSTEASELLALFRFKNNDEIEKFLSSPEGRKKVGQELADILFFLLRFAERYDFDVYDELVKKLELNSKRYPVEKAKGSNKKYDEL